MKQRINVEAKCVVSSLLSSTFASCLVFCPALFKTQLKKCLQWFHREVWDGAAVWDSAEVWEEAVQTSDRWTPGR